MSNLVGRRVDWVHDEVCDMHSGGIFFRYIEAEFHGIIVDEYITRSKFFRIEWDSGYTAEYKKDIPSLKIHD